MYIHIIIPYIQYVYIHVALAVYTRSPCAYEALKSFDILQLPSVSSLKQYTSANIEAPGEIDERLSRSRKQYKEHVLEHVAKGFKKPLGEGVLIVDEVKVCCTYIYKYMYCIPILDTTACMGCIVLIT